MPNSGIKTIIVDSLTAIISPLVIQAMIDSEKGREKNLMSAFRTKALAMRQLQDAITRWGTDVLWIYHLQNSRNAKAQEVTKASVSQTEIARLTRSINLKLEIVQDKEKDMRGMKVTWARGGRSGMVIWDKSGIWKDMPERIEKAVYGGLSKKDQDQIRARTPKVFPNAEIAISWGFEQKAFSTIEASKRVFDQTMREAQPSSAREMTDIWVRRVQEQLQRFGENKPQLHAV